MPLNYCGHLLQVQGWAGVGTVWDTQRPTSLRECHRYLFSNGPASHSWLAGCSLAVSLLMGHHLSRFSNHHLLKWQPEPTLGPNVNNTKHAFPKLAVGPLLPFSSLDIQTSPQFQSFGVFSAELSFSPAFHRKVLALQKAISWFPAPPYLVLPFLTLFFCF